MQRPGLRLTIVLALAVASIAGAATFVAGPELLRRRRLAAAITRTRETPDAHLARAVSRLIDDHAREPEVALLVLDLVSRNATGLWSEDPGESGWIAALRVVRAVLPHGRDEVRAALERLLARKEPLVRFHALYLLEELDDPAPPGDVDARRRMFEQLARDCGPLGPSEDSAVTAREDLRRYLEAALRRRIAITPPARFEATPFDELGRITRAELVAELDPWKLLRALAAMNRLAVREPDAKTIELHDPESPR